jgi:hypothetical protein
MGIKYYALVKSVIVVERLNWKLRWKRVTEVKDGSLVKSRIVGVIERDFRSLTCSSRTPEANSIEFPQNIKIGQFTKKKGCLGQLVRAA